MDAFDGHLSAVVLMDTHELEDTTLLLSSSRQDVKLWDGMGMSRGPVVTWEQVTRGRFNHAGTQVRRGGVENGWLRPPSLALHTHSFPPPTHAPAVHSLLTFALPHFRWAQVSAVSSSGTPRHAYIYDVASHQRLATLADSASASSPSPLSAERAQRSALTTAWSPADDLVLWGCTLWDPRMPQVG
jgi:hypothetical protein